jgi:hydroxyacylglutathione hydrolase
MSALDVRAFTVGPVQENSYIVRADAQSTRAVIVDPGEEADRLLAAAAALGVKIEAILLTHCHFDHIGAVAPVARATGAPVYCPEIERPVLADVMSWVPPGFGPFESYEADHTVAGGERLNLAGLDIDVIFTPGHSPGHVTYAVKGALLSGDVLFQGSVGRVDLPGGDWTTLERSIETLVRAYPAETAVYPGHMGVTTLGRELETNPFLSELRARLPRTEAMAEAPAPAPPR